MSYTVTLQLDERFNPGSLAAHTISELGDVWGAGLPPQSWAEPQTRALDIHADSIESARAEAFRHPLLLSGLAHITAINPTVAMLEAA